MQASCAPMRTRHVSAAYARDLSMIANVDLQTRPSIGVADGLMSVTHRAWRSSPLCAAFSRTLQ